jgi:type III secretion protein T
MSLSFSAILLAASRTAPIAWLVSPYGGGGGAARWLIGLALAAAALVTGGSQAPEGAPLLPALVGEITIGLVLGLVVAVPFRAAEAAGGLIDFLRRPRRADGLFGRMLPFLGLALFAALDGPRLWYEALARSYVVLPVGHFPVAAGLTVALGAGARLIGLGVAMATPALLAALLVELLLGLWAWSAPTLRRVDLAALREPLVVALVAATATVAVVALRGGLQSLAREMEDALRLLAG